MISQSILGGAKAGCFVCLTDRARAKAFYGETLGLKPIHEDNFATVFDSNGSTLRVSPAKDFKPQPFTVLGWEVPQIRTTVKAPRSGLNSCGWPACRRMSWEYGRQRFSPGSRIPTAIRSASHGTESTNR